MFHPKDYVRPVRVISCVFTETYGKTKKNYSRSVETHEIFKVFTATWVEYRKDYHLVLFAPLFESVFEQKSLILIEGYGRDFEKIIDKKQISMLKLLYG